MEKSHLKEIYKKNLLKYKNKKILILGLGKTGIEVYCFLEKYKITNQIFLSDKRNLEEIKIQGDLFKSKKENFFSHEDISKEFLSEIDYIIKSPGISHKGNPILRLAKLLKISVISELDLFYDFLDPQNKPKIIGITGTNGKTTSLAILNSILKSMDIKSALLGNLGIPVLSYYTQCIEADILILEMSSFILEDTKNIQLDIACVLNITPNHLDHHSSFENYIYSKLKIFSNQDPKKDFSIWNADYPYFKYIQDKAHGKTLFFSLNHKKINDQDMDFYVYKNWIYNKKEEKIFCIDKLNDSQRFYLETVVACISISRAIGIPYKSIEKGLLEFKIQNYRFQKLGSINDILFINDSKSTNPYSVLHAIKNLPKNKYSILIMGGINKNIDFSFLRKPLIEKKIQVILYGQSAENINSMINLKDTLIFKKLDEAFIKAYSMGKNKNALVLFSPGCSSFDQYESYEKRGKHFQSLFENLQKNE